MPTRFARSRADEGHGFSFFSSASIMRARRRPSATVSYRAKKYIKQCMVESGTILICRSGAFGGIMGHATFVSPAMRGWAITEHMIRCKITDPDFLPEYVLCFLGSYSLGYPIITSYRHGKDVPELEPEHLESISIPKLPLEEQETIAQNIHSAFADFDRANELEDEAQKEMQAALQWTEYFIDINNGEDLQTEELVKS